MHGNVWQLSIKELHQLKKKGKMASSNDPSLKPLHFIVCGSPSNLRGEYISRIWTLYIYEYFSNRCVVHYDWVDLMLRCRMLDKVVIVIYIGIYYGPVVDVVGC